MKKSYAYLFVMALLAGTTMMSTAARAGDVVAVPDGAGGANDIVADSIVAGDIATGAVTTAEILDGTVATADLADGSVTTAKIVDANVTTAKVADDAITSAKIAADTIVAGDIATGAVTTTEILDGTVATADLADSSVTTAKITNLNVTTAKIADSAVTTAKIADGSVTMAKLGADVTGAFDDLKGGIAMSTAIANIPGIPAGKEFAVGVGGGYYADEYAGAVKMGYAPMEFNNVQVGASVAYSSQDEVSGGVGVSVGF